MRSQDIRIPEPCHADWDGMRPEDKGRFCSSCNKKVHDLSAMTKDEAEVFLHRAACEDVCVSYQHLEDGTLVFREPAARPAPVVPLARLRRPRAVAAAVAGAGVAMALAACTPHGEAPVRYSADETPMFHEPSVVIPHGTQPPAPEPSPPPTHVDEPCDSATEEAEPPSAEPPSAEPERPRVRGKLVVPVEPRVRRTAGKPVMATRKKGELRRAQVVAP